MGILIYKSNYKRGGKKVSRYVTYIGTRPGVIKMLESKKDEPATKHQKKYIEDFAKKHSEIRSLDVFRSYSEHQSLGSASELISYIEETYDEKEVQGIEGYLQYMATRPGVVKAGSNGLFSDKDGLINMEEVKRKLENNKGVIFQPIVSLKREDAEAIGYTSPKKWQDLIRAHRNEIAQLYKIDPENFEWYGAFHDEPDHPHVHLLFFSKDGKQGWQNQDTFEKMKRLLSTDMFRDYRQKIYEQKNELRAEIKQTAQRRIEDLLKMIERKEEYPENIAELMYLLKESMRGYKGRMYYQYLPPNKKLIVDNIINQLAKDPDIKEFLKQWDILQGKLQSLYRQDGYQSIPLSEMKEFRSIKNMILEEAMQLPERELNVQPPAAKEKQLPPQQRETSSHQRTAVYKGFAAIARNAAGNHFSPGNQPWMMENEFEAERERKIAQGMKVNE